MDRNASKSFTPFIKLTATEDETREAHLSIAPDLDLANLALQYQDMQCCDEFHSTNPSNVLQSMLQRARKEYHEISIALGRILVCKLHSVDWERLISLYNKIKSTCRSSL